MTMNFVIFGPPGSGKGTYSRRLQEKLGIPAISTGDIFREARQSGSELGNRVKGFMDRGELVPDDITNEVLRERISKPDCERGFILDGYPRTIEQAEYLETIRKIDAIINLIIPDEILIEKLTARRVCENCGDIYNIADIDKTLDGVHYVLPPMSPKKEGRCDKCGARIVQRPDDTEDVIRNRLEVYKRQSAPVAEFYKSKVKFVDVHVTNGPEIMVPKILDMLKKAKLVK